MNGRGDSSSATGTSVLSYPDSETFRGSRGGGVLARGPFVRIMTVVIVGITLMMVSLIYWRWATVREPSTAVVIAGDSSLEGAQVTVVGEGRQLPPITLGPDNNFVTPVLLDEGQYTAQVTHDQHRILDEPFVVHRFTGVRFELPSAVPVMGVATGGPLEVQVDSETGARAQVTLNDGDKYHATLYLQPGAYRTTVLRQNRIIARQDFVLTRGKPTTIDVRNAPPADR